MGLLRSKLFQNQLPNTSSSTLAPSESDAQRWKRKAFKVVVTDPDSVLSTLTREIKESGPDGQEVTKVVPALSEEVKDALVENIRRLMTPQPLKIRANIEMKCFQFDGVLHIKEAMRKAEATGNINCPVKIKLVAPSLYVLTTQTLDKFLSCMLMLFRVQKPEGADNFRVLMKHRQSVTAVALSEDDLKGYSASKDGTIVQWEVDGGKAEKYRWPSDEILKSHGVKDPQSRATKHSKHVLALAVSSDGRYLASGGLDRHVHLWDTRT